MYTSGSITNLQRMLSEINESGAFVPVKIYVESDTINVLEQLPVKCHMLISFPTLCLQMYSVPTLCLQMYSEKCFNIYFHELKIFSQIFESKVYESVVLKNNSLWTVLWTVCIIFINKLQISCRSCFNILTQKYVSEEWEQI